jgi:arginase
MTSMTKLGLLGAPSSAGAYSPGQERAPSALRDAGLVAALTAAGLDVTDHGDVAGVRWTPDAEHPRAQNLDAVVTVAHSVAHSVAEILREGARALVLGGDCTVGIGTVAGAGALARPGLVYLDLHADLNIPTSTVDGALDWMGLAHMLGSDGACPPLRDAGPRTPLLDPGDVVLLGYDERPATAHERATIAELELAVVPIARVTADPQRAAADALGALAGHAALVVHFDVDVVNFLDAPLSENVERGGGAALAQALAALTVLLADSRVVALTVTELNPDHGDDATLRRFADGLVAALGAPASPP